MKLTSSLGSLLASSLSIETKQRALTELVISTFSYMSALSFSKRD